MKRRRILLIAAAAVLLVFATFRLAGPASEPSYLGKPITYWIEPWQHHNMEPESRVTAAFAEMDDKAIRWLVRALDWKPSPFRRTANKALRRFEIVWPDEPDRRERAAMGLGQIGGRARSAIPALEHLRTNAVQPRAAASRHASTAALILIRQEPIPKAVERMLQDQDPAAFGDLAMTLAFLGRAAVEAVPRMSAALDATNPPAVRANAAMALGSIRSSPGICVPALAGALATLEQPVQEQVLSTLSAFGQRARAASPQVVLLLSGSNRWVAARASNTLAVIDPETAKRYGIAQQEP